MKKTNINTKPFYKPIHHTDDPLVSKILGSRGWRIRPIKDQVSQEIKPLYLFALFLVFLVGMTIMVYALDYANNEREKTLRALEARTESLQNDNIELMGIFCTKKCEYEQMDDFENKQQVLDDIDRVLIDVCLDAGYEESFCWNDLRAICTVESNCRPDAVNVNTNQSVDSGAFQISSIHNFESAFDFRASAKWTLDNLVNHGYPQYRTRAIAWHHSRTPTLGEPYAEKVKDIANSF